MTWTYYATSDGKEVVTLMCNKQPMSRHDPYRYNYPPLLRALERLAERARRDDPNIALLALFGSVARLEPDPASDTDVLIVVDDPDRYLEYSPDDLGAAAEHSAPTQPQGGALVVGVGDEGRHASWPAGGCSWELSVLLSDARGEALSAALRADLARDGVLLYRRPDYDPPEALARLQPYSGWRERVGMLLRDGTTG